MNDLRALLGDRYVSTMRAAVLADNPEAINRLDRTLAAVLPDLLAAAWDEGWDAAADAAEQCTVTDGYGPCGECATCDPANPYRSETTAGEATDAPVTLAAPDAINPPPDPSAAVTGPHSPERTTQ